MKKHTLSKNERLKSRTLINGLFQKGKSVFVYPIKLVYTPIPEDFRAGTELPPGLFSVSVPRRQFKKAVIRNRIKRLVRESYRLNKNELYNSLNTTSSKLALMYIFIGQKPEDADMLGNAIPAIHKKLLEQILSQRA